jgi:hypothetical protein
MLSGTMSCGELCQPALDADCRLTRAAPVPCAGQMAPNR